MTCAHGIGEANGSKRICLTGMGKRSLNNLHVSPVTIIISWFALFNGAADPHELVSMLVHNHVALHVFQLTLLIH
jgi:hypothetical protein